MMLCLDNHLVDMHRELRCTWQPLLLSAGVAHKGCLLAMIAASLPRGSSFAYGGGLPAIPRVYTQLELLVRDQ